MTDRDKLIEAMARAFDVSPFFAGVGLRRLEAHGLAIVPVEPTEAMIDAGHALDPLGCDVEPDSAGDIYGRIWFGMIQAARGGV